MRLALLVGINDYANAPPLQQCVGDAEAMAVLLRHNEDETPNYKCELLTSAGAALVTRAAVQRKWADHLHEFTGDALFYFSGHGAATELGGHLITYDGVTGDPGLPMDALVKLANRSKANNVTIILDCCYAGAAGSDEEVVGTIENDARLREGVTILAGSRPRQRAMELGGHGVFTRLVMAALAGGAADVRGRVSAAAIYAYAEAVLGALDQRPLYKSHAASLDPVRRCLPVVHDQVLRGLPEYFPTAGSVYRMAPSYERTHAEARDDHVAVFRAFKELQVARLLRCEVGRDMYDTALASQTVHLTPLGQFYWELAKADELRP